MKRFGLALAASIMLAVTPALAQLAPAPLRPTFLAIDSGTKTATAVAGAATLNKSSGVVTSEALTTAAAADYTLTITDANVAVGDIVLASVANGTNTGGDPDIGRVTAGAGTITIVVRNPGTTVLNGTVVVSFVIIKA